jgi:hypothetical protein
VLVQGSLRTSSGEPLVGVNVMIKGTNQGVVTDADGNYSIEAPPTAVLVFSLIGFSKKEVPVSSLVKIPPGNGQSEGGGYTTLNAPDNGKKSLTSPTIRHAFTVKDGKQLHLVKKYEPNSLYKLGKAHKNNGIIRFHLSFSSSLRVDQVSKLPELQKDYASGRNEGGSLVWKGPEDNEQFSWGPAITALEYDGNPYPYDKRGRIVATGLGSGTPVTPYNPYHFFRKALSSQQSLVMSLNNSKHSLRLAYNNINENGIIRGSGIQRDNVLLDYKSTINPMLEFTLGLKYLQTEVRELSGFGQYRIMESVLKNPVSFDMGTRMHASDSLTSPYWFQHSIQDVEKTQWYQGRMNLGYQFNESYKAVLTASFENQYSRDEFGFMSDRFDSTEGFRTERESSLLASYLKAGLSAQYDLADITWDWGLFYELSNHSGNLQRTNPGLNLADFDSDYDRKVQAIIPSINLKFHEVLLIELSARSVISNTFEKNYFTPSVGLSYTPNAYSFTYDPINKLVFFGSYTSGINAVPLAFRRGLYNSTLYSSQNMDQYYETAEFRLPASMEPEFSTRWELGSNLDIFDNNISTEITFYTGKTRDALVPRFKDGSFEMSNGCDLRSQGFDLDLKLRIWRRYNSSFTTGLIFSVNRTKVIRVNDPSGIIVIGGLSDVPVVLIKDQPYGVLMGTSYQYTAGGKVIVGNDGFPLVDNAMKVVGNPNPDWIMGWNNHLRFGNLTLSCTFDIRKGGDIWNGTRSALNYLGLSHETGEKRLIESYVFDGVKADGTVNDIPVSFYDPNLPLSQNRWVRYGPSGVTTEAMEDGSWIRLSELGLTYSLPSWLARRKKLEKINLTIFTNNLLVFTNYSGVDPQSRFLGFENNNGIDYFNTPGVKTIGLSVEIGF